MRVNRRSHRGVATPPAHLACCRGHALARTQKRARTSTHGRACQAHARKVAAKKRTHEEKRMRTREKLRKTFGGAFQTAGYSTCK